MLNFFKHSYISQQTAIVAIAVVLWLPAFLSKSAFIPGEYNTPLYNIIISIIDISPFITNAIAFAVYLINVFLFNSILTANRLVGKYSTIGALAFVLMMCCCPELHLSYPFIFACPFILMAMHTLFLIYQTDNPENYMMNIGYFIAIASLFYYPSIFLIFWVLVSFVILGFKGIRYALIPITGFLIVNAIVIGISFLFGNVDNMIESYSIYFDNISFSFDMNVGEKLLLTVSFVLFILSLLLIFGNKNSDRSTNIRKRIAVGITLTILSIFMFFVNKPLMSNMLIFVMFSFFFSIALSDIKKSKIANIIMFLVIIMILANQYLPLFGLKI